MNHVKEILCGIAILVGIAMVLVAVVGGPIFVGHQNSEKEKHMTEFCIEHGFDGWNDTAASRNGNNLGASTCIND